MCCYFSCYRVIHPEELYSGGHNPKDDVIVLSSSDGINLSYAISIQDIKNEG